MHDVLLMALFGAPVAHEDHAARACYAALRMLWWITLSADELQRGGGTLVQIRVAQLGRGGRARAIGSDLQMDYSAIGQTTHLAARMEQIARPGSVLVTGDTLSWRTRARHPRLARLWPPRVSAPEASAP